MRSRNNIKGPSSPRKPRICQQKGASIPERRAPEEWTAEASGVVSKGEENEDEGVSTSGKVCVL